MNIKRQPIFTNALNSATRALNAISGAFHELAVPEGETTIRFTLCRYGEYPVKDVTGVDIVQVVDREAAETLAANFGSLYGKFATFFRGVPMFEGHADDEKWMEKHPGHRASAVARIKSIEPLDDRVEVTAALNSDGINLLSGEAPKYTGQSPLWRLVPIAGRAGHYRPILLWSVALTNNPNIMTNTIALNSLLGVADSSPTAETGATEQTEDMKLTADALAALGFAPDATPSNDEISAAIVKMIGEKLSAEADKATAETAVTAANSRATQIEGELTLVRGAAVDTVIGAAVQDGRITEADKPRWVTALNTSFQSEAAKLGALMPTVNVRNQIDGIAARKGDDPLAKGIDACNTAVRELAAANGLNLAVTADYDRAWKMLRTAKPELFAKA